ncbi:transcription factor PIL1-like [Salvia hispanica]|uniref:transcription factor PIL1-like n=1 Tax=Salvia hispanica TaxID=49212 RepID=UPI0020096037|nr:transcription factor PIL1-like [Salvia hispanica]
MHASRNDEAGQREKPETSKQSKGKRSIQARRVCRRISRQKINGRLKALQELIPNCSERGQASILDDAINYINNLSFQLRMMMSMRAIWSTLRPPDATMPRTYFPSRAPLSQGTGEMKYEIGMRTPANVFSSANFPMGLIPYDPSILPSQPPLYYNQILSQSHPISGRSTARVLPTRIVPPLYDHDVVEDQSYSESSEWYSGSETE